ncbi:uncharacterized protein LOC111241707 isoform X4 [Vigna radiata var. radiata]|uniref:Uncharacterized protein LOC111241707 isoform X4 n=1 Tax=Vigna radiata var. radiata TaxID=3916 RepID=A0A3Q0EZE8_VIGRR|nr:uncharacterized protein LOC111241707 isoform X4 [Vigna radiata var. radiata]
MVCYEASTRLLNGVSLKALEWSYGKRLERFHFEPFLSQCSAPISLWGFFMVALRLSLKQIRKSFISNSEPLSDLMHLILSLN